MEEFERWVQIFVLTFITIPVLTFRVVVGRYIYHPISPGPKWKVNTTMAGKSVLGFEFLRTRLQVNMLEINKIVKAGQKAPNEAIVSPDGKTYKKILDLQRKDRPLVLNFGSCT